MEYRKLVKFGTATYCVSLPKRWIREHKLTKGDIMTIEEAEDGSLKVFGKDLERIPEIKEISIDISKMTSEEIKRQVLVSYINDYSIIHLRGNVGMRTKELRQIFQQFVALEVLDLNDEKITAKAFVDISDTNPLKILRRVDTITKTMFTELPDSIQNEERSRLINEKDSEVNRLYYFALKLITRGLEDGSIANHWGFSKTELAFVMVLADKLEKIADRVKRLSIILSHSPFNEDEVTLLSEHFKRVEENYRLAMTAFYKNNTTLAHQVIDTHQSNMTFFDTFAFTCLQKTTARVGCGIPMVLEFLARISTLTEDIARIVLDLHPTSISPGSLTPHKNKLTVVR